MIGIEQIIDICTTVTHILSHLDTENNIPQYSNQLIYPIKLQAKGEVTRDSEQEFKLLFIQTLLKKYKDIYYSIETPTKVKYNFTDKNEINWFIDTKGCQSALTDLTLFLCQEFKYTRLYNIEFKNGHKKKGIAKDLFKLICEPKDSIFIVSINRVNSNTMNVVFDKINFYLELFSSRWDKQNIKKIHFIFCVISRQKIYHKVISSNTQKLIY